MSKPLRILIGCEYSARVRDAFRARGHDAWSCDLLECEGDPAFHIQGDVFEAIANPPAGAWDMAIFHPTCTYLTNAGVRWLYNGGRKDGGRDEQRWEDMREGAAFINRLLDCGIPKIAVENPIMHGYGQELVGPPSQIVQPWWFGDEAFKATGFWIRGDLPLLQPTNKLAPPASGTAEHARWSKVHRASPGPDRWKDRSRTEPGLAKGLAINWSPDLSL